MLHMRAGKRDSSSIYAEKVDFSPAGRHAENQQRFCGLKMPKGITKRRGAMELVMKAAGFKET